MSSITRWILASFFGILLAGMAIGQRSQYFREPATVSVLSQVASEIEQEFMDVSNVPSLFKDKKALCKLPYQNLSRELDRGGMRVEIRRLATELTACYLAANEVRQRLFPLAQALSIIRRAAQPHWTQDDIAKIMGWQARLDKLKKKIRLVNESFPSDNEIDRILLEADAPPELIASIFQPATPTLAFSFCPFG